MISPEPPYTVKTPLLFWFGGIALLVTIAMVITSWGNWLGVLLLTTMFGGASAALFLMSATISADSEGMTINRPGSTKKIRWSEVTRVAEGGGNLVIHTHSGRATAPSFEFWTGPDRAALIGLLVEQLNKRRIPFRGNSLRAAMQVGDR